MSSQGSVPSSPTRHLAGTWLFCVALCLSLFVLRTYLRVYNPRFGWTKLIVIGAAGTNDDLPRLRQLTYYVDPLPEDRFGYDGQFYAQLALDPSLRDPALVAALDLPAYRARRIGLPALAFCLGWGNPGRIIQAYALANLFFWFLLLGALSSLFRPWTGKQLLCLSAGLLSYGVIASMSFALTDLPAAALVFLGAAIGSWGGYLAFSGAVLTRETSLLAAFGFLDLRRPWRSAVWRRNLGLLALAIVPLAAWLIYVGHRFGGGQGAAGEQNFAWPLQAMFARFTARVYQCAHGNPGQHAAWYKWFYKDHNARELMTIVGIFVQGLFFILRQETQSPFWRTGVCYLALGCVLGPAVWEQAGAAARVLLPMTLCFYLLLARERAGWFWPFFVLGSLSIPYGVREFWLLSG
jgi:hypothetical protein